MWKHKRQDILIALIPSRTTTSNRNFKREGVCEVCAQLFNKVSTGFLVGKKNSIKIVLTLLTNNYYEKNNFTKINVPAMRPGSRKWKCVGR